MTGAEQSSGEGKWRPLNTPHKTNWSPLIWTGLSLLVHAAIAFRVYDSEVVEIRVAFEEQPHVMESRFVPVPPPREAEPPPPREAAEAPPDADVVERLLATEEDSPIAQIEPVPPEDPAPEPPPEPPPEPVLPDPPPLEDPEPEPEPEPEPDPPEEPEPVVEIEPEPEPAPPEPVEEPAPEPMPEPPPEPETVEEVETPAPDQPDPSARVELDTQPSVRHNPPPRYPRAAERRGEEGVVSLRVETDENGRVTHVELLGTSGSNLLDRSALSTVGRWRFEPTLRGGRPVPAAFVVDVNFSLGD
ncbi:MAG: energy transducer TonB [Opitutales bacterium]|nr:energy transducer TonB [Opitutales bacterium]